MYQYLYDILLVMLYDRERGGGKIINQDMEINRDIESLVINYVVITVENQIMEINRDMEIKQDIKLSKGQKSRIRKLNTT